MLRPLVRRHGLEPSLQAILSSDQAGTYKPEARANALVTQRFEADPADVAFVSAHGWDLAGAACAGFRTVWIQREGRPLDRVGVTPDLRITDLRQLPAALQRSPR